MSDASIASTAVHAAPTPEVEQPSTPAIKGSFVQLVLIGLGPIGLLCLIAIVVAVARV